MRAFVYYAPPAAADNVYLFRLNGVLPSTTTSVNAQMGAEGFPYGQPMAPNFVHLSTLIYHSAIKSADHFAYRARGDSAQRHLDAIAAVVRATGPFTLRCVHVLPSHSQVSEKKT